MRQAALILMGWACVLWQLAPAQDGWKLEAPITTWNDLASVVWTGSEFIAVGQNGTLIASAAGTDWQRFHSPTGNGLHSIALGRDGLAAVGDTGTILISKNGSDWTAVNTGTWKNFKQVLFDSSRYLAVGDAKDNSPAHPAGPIYSSPDGSTWTLAGGETLLSLNAIARAGGHYVAAGSNAPIYTSADGTNWKSVTPPMRLQEPTIAASPTRFVVTTGSDAILVSTDATAWQTVLPMAGDSLDYVFWLNNRFIALGRPNAILTSGDGQIWKQASLSSPARLRSVAWSGSAYVAVGDTGAIFASSDASVWSRRSSPAVPRFEKVLFAQDRLYGFADGSLYMSTDALAWAPVSLPERKRIRDICWNGKRIFILASDSTAMSSADGIAWAKGDTKFEFSEGRLAAAGDSVVAIGPRTESLNDPPKDRLIAYLTRDSAAWDRVYLSDMVPPFGMNSLAWTGHRFWGLTSYGIFSSPDGHAWTRTDPTYYNWEYPVAIADNGKMGLLATFEGYVRDNSRSLDWITAAGPFPRLTAILWCVDRFFAAGVSGTLMQSPDGKNWAKTAFEYADMPELSNLVRGGNRIYAFGKRGLVLSTAIPDSSAVSVRAPFLFPHGDPNRVIRNGSPGDLAKRNRSVTGRRIRSGAGRPTVFTVPSL